MSALSWSNRRDRPEILAVHSASKESRHLLGFATPAIPPEMEDWTNRVRLLDSTRQFFDRTVVSLVRREIPCTPWDVAGAIAARGILLLRHEDYLATRVPCAHRAAELGVLEFNLEGAQ